MRNKVQLYIEGERADLDNGSFLLLNYTAEDLSNPTVVRNSFSKQITLPGTPRNDALFGFIFRNDRNTLYGSPYNGAYFDPCRKTAFALYSDEGLLLESGYLKLEKVSQTKRKRAYTVSLYGGLGSFLYGLSYDSNGDKLTLADLTYPYTLDFTIDRATVKAAWDQLDNDPDGASKWSVINFIPCYMGLPSGEFNADKAVVNAAKCGLPTSDGDYTTQDGWTLVTLPEKVTGNEAKDYRSYLQKPCLRMKALVNAICNPANNGGYTVNLDSEFFDDSNPYWAKTWLTLPKMQDLNLDIVSANGTLPASFSTISIPDGGSLSTMYTVNIKLSLEPIFDAAPQWSRYWMHCEDDWAAGSQVNDNPGYYVNYIETTVRALDSNDNIIKEIIFRVSTTQTPDGQVQMDDVFDYITDGNECMKGASLFFERFTIQEYGIAKISISQVIKSLSWGNLRASGNAMLVFPQNTYDYTLGETIHAYNLAHDDSEITWSSVSSSTARTGASVTKAALLSTEHTPADYLLSFCKMFGLQMVVHKDEKVVDITMRKNLYSSSVVDINGRIDRGRGVEKVPFSFDARWYLFGNPAAGDYAEYYANKYGMPFGQYRVNTGYEFDASEKSLTDSIVFNNACDVVETSKYYCDLTSPQGTSLPALFIDGGKYTLYKGGGESKDYDIPLPIGATKRWNNASYPMHDDWPKMQMHKADNAPMDERDTLVFFDGVRYPDSDHVSLTDDTRQMLQLNGNAPCWLPHYSEYDSTWQLAKMPQFSRHIWQSSNVNYSLDFGTPSEVLMPAVNFNADSNIYDQYWDRYIADRYDDDSAVVTAYVDLRGMQVDENLLRQFYAFDGAVWALNRIIDHSLTTSGPTRCEFVKVQDTSNYTSI